MQGNYNIWEGVNQTIPHNTTVASILLVFLKVFSSPYYLMFLKMAFLHHCYRLIFHINIYKKLLQNERGVLYWLTGI